MKEKDGDKGAHYRDRLGTLLVLLLFVWHLAGVYH